MTLKSYKINLTRLIHHLVLLESGFASFTADQWKHWILIYSSYALKGVLPQVDYNCWTHLVKACKLFCQMIITKEEILQAHELMVTFCKTFEHLYGSIHCTPNMHMACHLKDPVQRYGQLPPRILAKEMRPSHRIDILSSALAYYGIKTKNKLGENFKIIFMYVECIAC